MATPHPSTPLLRIALALLLASAFVSLAFAAGADARGGGISPDGGGGGSNKTSSPDATLAGVSPSYAKFSAKLADKTGLSLRVIGGWALAEGGPKDNPLNIGPGKHYGTVNKGARATAKLLRTDLYRKIMRSRSRKDGRQIKAIANSSWCPGCRGYGKLLRSAYRQVSVE